MISRRLRSYWILEAGCAIALPLMGFVLVEQAGDRVGVATAIAMFAASGLLVIGALCWRMALASATGDRRLADRLMALLKPSRTPARMMALIGGCAAIVEAATEGGFTPSAIAALTFGGLAILEYVNYFEVQLQHFDHLPDFKRLMAGKGFRKPYLAKAIFRTTAEAPCRVTPRNKE
jgi:hypothetical protein